jgi:hypothetical protein
MSSLASSNLFVRGNDSQAIVLEQSQRHLERLTERANQHDPVLAAALAGHIDWSKSAPNSEATNEVFSRRAEKAASPALMIGSLFLIARAAGVSSMLANAVSPAIGEQMQGIVTNEARWAATMLSCLFAACAILAMRKPFTAGMVALLAVVGSWLLLLPTWEHVTSLIYLAPLGYTLFALRAVFAGMSARMR